MRCVHMALVGLCGLVMLAAGCQDTSDAARGGVVPPPTGELQPYARARWRLARERLHRVLLRVSHVAIRHRGSVEEGSRLRTVAWLPDAPQARSRRDAIAIAARVAQQAQRVPQDFPSLAREHSEDVVTASWGGSLGTVPASQLPDAFLDAIATLEPGQVSRPFETPFGIHVVKLDPTPPAMELSASRVLIAYRDSGPAIPRAGHTKARSRHEALALAQRVAAEARMPDVDFGDLVERYTDSPDVAQRGDLGVWSTHDPMIRHLVLEALSRVPIGGVTEPVDSPEGIQVLKRTALEPRQRFSAEYVVVSPLGRSREAMRAEMAEILAEVKGDSAAFDEVRRRVCCSQPWTWSRGRGLGPQVEEVLQQLQSGQLAAEPVETETGIYLVKKHQPLAEEALATLVRLPSPDAPDLDALLRDATGPLLEHNLRLMAQHISAMPLSNSKKERLAEVVDGTAAALLSADGAQRPALLAGFWQDAASVLSPQEVVGLRAAVVEFTAGYFMKR